jgi:hypothetical protein
MLPKGAGEITVRDLATLDKWFGLKRKFPEMKIATGEVGL